MLIVMDSAASAEDIRRVVETVEGLGLQAHPIPGAQRTAIGITGNRGTVDPGAFENLPGRRARSSRSRRPYKLVSREAKRENTVVSVGGVPVGGERLAVVAGPCAVESRSAGARDRPRGSARPAPRSTAAAPSSRGPRPTPSRGSARRACRSSRASATRRACRSSPRCSTPRPSSSSRSTPTASRSARATCRTSRS